MFCELPIRVDNNFDPGMSCTRYNHRHKRTQLMARQVDGVLLHCALYANRVVDVKASVAREPTGG